MTLPSSDLIGAAQAAASRMADRDTPFIFNEWYVAAYADEIGCSLFKRTLLGREVVMFRTEAGTPVALDDRCIHRSFPLSAGTLANDTVVCGYHGFRYDASGNLVEVPSQPRCPRGLGVRNYPLHEMGSLIWIWMGDEPADLTRLPPHEWLISSAWTRSAGYLHLRGNYVSLHENLLDLTHLSYLHAKSFGTPDYASAAFRSDIGADTFTLYRDVVPTTLPPVWAKPTGMEGYPNAARMVCSQFQAPSMHCVSVRFYDNALPEENRPEFRIRTAHMPTPETHGSTHYFIVNGRDFALGDDEMTRFMHEQLFVAFNEDVVGLEALEHVLAQRGEDFFEISVASDRPSVEMRKYLKARAEAEAAARGRRAEQSVAAPSPLSAVG